MKSARLRPEQGCASKISTAAAAEKGAAARHSWQLSDESDEEEGITPLENEPDVENDEEELDLGDEKFDEE